MANPKKKMKEVSGVKDHAEFSASGSSRWLNCPGSIALSKTCPEPPESEYAAEGTKAHECMEFLLKNRAAIRPAKRIALKNYPADMIEHAMTVVDWVEDQLRLTPDATLMVETKVDASPFTCEGQFGTLDIAIVRPFGRLTIADFKYGAGVVVDPGGYDGQGNPQLVYYGLGLSHLYKHNFSEVELVVIQPRAYHESGDAVRSVVLPMKNFLSWQSVFKNGVKAAKREDAPFSSGEWCRFCSAAVKCPELKDKAIKQAQVAFSDEVGLQSVPEPKLIALPHLGTILAGCEKLEAWIEKVREHATYLLEQGEDVAGYKLVEKRGQRKWADEGEGFMNEVTRKFGSEALTEPKLLSPAQFEKKFKGSNEWLEKRVTCKSSGTTMVKESDPRPSLRPTAEVFAIPATPVKTIRRAKK